MRKYFYAAIIGLISCSPAVGQRPLQVLIDGPYESGLQTVSTNREVIISITGQDHLLKYNDILLLRYNFPSFFGVRLRASGLPLASFRSSTYIVLNLGEIRVLHAFNGSSFTGISVPGTIVAGPITFGDNLYVLSRRAGLVRLYRYNGTSVTEIPSANLPDRGFYELRIAGNYLYLIGNGRSGMSDVLKRYDGTSTFTFPGFYFGGGIEQILPIGETGRVYFVANQSDIFYYNGTSLSTVFDGLPGTYASGVVWGDDLYFLDAYEGGPEPLHRVTGTTVSSIPLPAGVSVFSHSNLALYNGALYLQITDAPMSSKILRYDGASFSDFFTIPGDIRSSGNLFIRDGNLIIQPVIINSRYAYEYNGSTFTTLEGPPDYGLAFYLSSTDCNHLWWMIYFDYTLVEYRRVIVKESKGCLLSSPVLVVPRRFYEFERFSGVFAARGERESWSDIIVNWDFDPVCTVPQICPQPAFLITLSDAQDKIAWQQKFDKPVFITVPLDGKLPFRTTLSFSGQGLEDLILMDDDLIKKGITGIGFSFNYKEENFFLTARTKPGVTVPLLLTLLNKDGKEIWRKELKAPFITNIKDKVAETGEKLHFSVVSSQEEINTKIESSASFTYLNPSHGMFSINVKDKENADAELMITTILGQKLVSKRIKTPANVRVELPEYKAGLYVIIIQTKDGRKTNKIVWLK